MNDKILNNAIGVLLIIITIAIIFGIKENTKTELIKNIESRSAPQK